jgi:DHA3 family macrolide efflux protein-like MFS transporter
MFSEVAMPLGMMLFGPLGDVIKIEYLLIVAGAMSLRGYARKPKRLD